MLLWKTETRATYLVQKKVADKYYKLYLKRCVKDNDGKFRESFSISLKDGISFCSAEAAREAVKVLGNVYVKKLDWDTIKDPVTRGLIYSLSLLAK